MSNQLLQIVDAALADAARRSGPWLVCRPGCSQCCVGVFEISAPDAARLREGLRNAAPEPAARIQARVEASIARLTPWFPGDVSSGLLRDDAEAVDLFEEFANDEVCPVLDPATGTCDLYASRPILCRTFGPPVRDADGRLAVCELCFDGAAEQEIAVCEMDSSWRSLEDRAEAALGEPGRTLVAWALRGSAGEVTAR